MVRRLNFIEHCMVRMICALALVFVGLAHKPPLVDHPPVPASEIARYMLPDGTFAVLCLPSGEEKSGHHGKDVGSPCEACRLTGSVILPCPVDMTGMRIAFAGEHIAPAKPAQFDRPPLASSASPRGPPSGLISAA